MKRSSLGLAALWFCVSLAPMPALAGDEPLCGNGIVEFDKKEECDDGNLDAGDCCSPTCLFEQKGDPCGSDENPCTDDLCDGAGKCGEPNSADCDNSVYCDGKDVCVEGSCIHGGDPCPISDCSQCNEQSDSCFLAEAAPCTDDGNLCTNDLCDGTGTCDHPPIPLAPLCDWTIIGGSDTRTAGIRTAPYSVIAGSVCVDTAQIGIASTLTGTGSWALLGDTGTAATVRTLAAVENGSVATGGGCLEGFAEETIFGTTVGPICCADGDVELPGGIPANVINACGTNDLILDCQSSKAQVPSDIDLLDDLVATQSLGTVSVAPGASRTISLAAGLNVIDMDKLRIGAGGTLTLDAAGNTGVVAVLRLAHGVNVKLRGVIALAGGLTAANTVVYASDGNCNFGIGTTGAGAIFCPSGVVKMKETSQWNGAIGSGASVYIGWKVELTHTPFLGLAD